MRKILITGASGFFGWNLARRLRGGREVVGTFHRSPLRIEGVRMVHLDLAAPGEAERVVREAAPDCVLHAAAWIDVDRCERERETARLVNEEGTGRVAAAAAAAGARLVYFSTDMVFDGGRGMYAEEDEARPINRYGETKLAGERRAAGACPGAVILRLALMYGSGNPVHGSFLGWMLDRLERGEPVSLFTDQHRTPLFAGDACDAVGRILDRPDLRGVLHLAGPERVNRYEFGLRAAAVFGFPAGLIVPVRMADLPGLMARPKDNSMANRKASAALGIVFTGVDEGLAAVARARRGG
ncbi:MAG: SDR family oxidoreductase [bacterium]|nr:SDR family oxidoreductase [bacterium]